MDTSIPVLSLAAGAVAATVAVAPKIKARLVPFYEFDINDFFRSDGAQPEVATRRQDGFFRLGALFEHRFAKSRQMTSEAARQISDLQFTQAYRVPFQYSRLVREHLGAGTFMQSSAGVTLTHLVDEVSFHMSGTEAVMQAVRVARYHTRRSHLVRFAGAYHGWWGDVQPGIGNPISPHETYTLADMSERTLRVLRTRRDIACVLVNPLQGLHHNGNAPADSALVDSSRTGHFDRAAYSAWLQSLRQVCTERNIVLIFDEVFVGFRLAAGGAQEYFGVRADMVTYGKSLAGGLPVGAVCGRKDLMRRFREDRPVDVCFARGTFNSHPYVMTAMDEFLNRLDDPLFRSIYDGLDDTWNERARRLNDMLTERDLPVRVCNLSSIWMVHYTEPSRYNWMFQYYLRLEQLALSWVGTGRLIFSLNYTDADSAEVAKRFVTAAEKMKQDGWWWRDTSLTNKSIRRQILKEMLTRRFSR